MATKQNAILLKCILSLKSKVRGCEYFMGLYDIMIYVHREQQSASAFNTAMFAAPLEQHAQLVCHRFFLTKMVQKRGANCTTWVQLMWRIKENVDTVSSWALVCMQIARTNWETVGEVTESSATCTPAGTHCWRLLMTDMHLLSQNQENYNKVFFHIIVHWLGMEIISVA